MAKVTDEVAKVTDPLTGPPMFATLWEVSFTYRGEATSVLLVGSFNHWDSKAHPLWRKGASWHVGVYLPAGAYPYAFCVDGQVIRDQDPRRTLRGPLGSQYSIVKVPEEHVSTIPFAVTEGV
jgi:hypothetical protein